MQTKTKLSKLHLKNFLMLFSNVGKKHAEERLQEAVDKLAERWILEEAKYFDGICDF